MQILQKIIFLVLGLLTGKPAQEGGATGAAGAFNTVAFYGSLAGGVAWLFGPGRDMKLTFNMLELSAVGLACAIVGAIFLHLKPPGSP